MSKDFMHTKKFCPQCQKENKKSSVRFGVGMSTLVYYPPYYDENGNYHHNDMNRKTQEYHCSNGHSWSEEL